MGKTGREKLDFSETEEVRVFTKDDGTEVEEDVFSEFPVSTIFVMIPEVPFLPEAAADEIVQDTAEIIPEGVIIKSIHQCYFISQTYFCNVVFINLYREQYGLRQTFRTYYRRKIKLPVA